MYIVLLKRTRISTGEDNDAKEKRIGFRTCIVLLLIRQIG